MPNRRELLRALAAAGAAAGAAHPAPTPTGEDAPGNAKIAHVIPSNASDGF